MKWVKATLTFTLFMAAALQLGGCAGKTSYQARSMDTKESPLVNPEIFVKGEEGQALYRYVKPNLDIRQYTKVYIDPVLIYKDGELDAEQLKDYQTLANNAYVYLSQELAKSYQIVKSPEPGALRLQWAIIDADTSKPVRNTLSTFFPIGMAVSWVKLGATGKQSGVGEISSEFKMTDAMTGELLAAALDRRVGGKVISQLWEKWSNADDALKYWAAQVGYQMCETRGAKACVKPEN